MNRRVILIAAMVLVPYGVAAAEETPAQLLEDAIYQEETVGDQAAAIDLFQEVILTGAPPAIAAQAHYHLGQIYLAEGDLGKALTEAQTLRRAFNAEEFNALTAQLNRSIAEFNQKSRGEVVDGRYRNFRSGVEFTLPPGWSIVSEGPSSDTGEIVILEDANSNTVHAAVWTIPAELTKEVIAQWLEVEIGAKVRQRHEMGWKAYSIRLNDVSQPIINGEQGLVFIADYQDKDGNPMVEYMTSIYGEHSRAFFFARIAANELGTLKTRFDPIIYSAKVP